MILGLDTSNKYLNICLMDDDEIVDSVHELCFKRQSEEILPMIKALFVKNNISFDDVKGICVTEGPGSYTGIRIAMTVAKVWSKTKELNLYTLSSLLLMAGKDEKAVCYMDARANRGYFGVYDKGEVVIEDKIITNEEFINYYQKHQDYNYYGDLEIINKEDNLKDINNNFLLLKDKWNKIDNIDLLKAKYLKDNNEYMVNK